MKSPCCSRCVETKSPCIYKAHRKTGPKFRTIQNKQFESVDVNANTTQPTKAPEEPNTFPTYASVIEQEVTWADDDGEVNWAEDDTDGVLEKALNPGEFGLSMRDAYRLESFSAYLQEPPFSCSRKRFLAKLKAHPKLLVPFLLMRIANACSRLHDDKELKEKLYLRVCGMQECGMGPGSLFYSDPTVYMWVWFARLQYELANSKFVEACTTTSRCTQVVFLLGLDHLDSLVKTDGNMGRDFPTAKGELVPKYGPEQDDGVDPDMPLIEEKRRMFWFIVGADRWISLMIIRPSQMSTDADTPFLTRLPVRTGPGWGPPCGPFFGEAMKKLQENKHMPELCEGSAIVLMVTQAQTMSTWASKMLVEHTHEPPTDEALMDFKKQMNEFSIHMAALQDTTMYGQLDSDYMVRLMPIFSFWHLYKAALVKMKWLVDESVAIDSTGSSITKLHQFLFNEVLDKDLTLMENISKVTIKEYTRFWGAISLQRLVWDSVVRTLIQTIRIIDDYGKFIPIPPQKYKQARDLVQKLYYDVDSGRESPLLTETITALLEEGIRLTETPFYQMVIARCID